MSTLALTHGAISKALSENLPLTDDQRAALLTLVMADKRGQELWDLAQQWRPITTAWTERRVLVFEPGINGDGRTIAHSWHGRWFAGDIKDENEVWPTFWMPLPEAPTP